MTIPHHIIPIPATGPADVPIVLGGSSGGGSGGGEVAWWRNALTDQSWVTDTSDPYSGGATLTPASGGLEITIPTGTAAAEPDQGYVMSGPLKGLMPPGVTPDLDYLPGLISQVLGDVIGLEHPGASSDLWVVAIVYQGTLGESGSNGIAWGIHWTGGGNPVRVLWTLENGSWVDRSGGATASLHAVRSYLPGRYQNGNLRAVTNHALDSDGAVLANSASVNPSMLSWDRAAEIQFAVAFGSSTSGGGGTMTVGCEIAASYPGSPPWLE